MPDTYTNVNFTLTPLVSEVNVNNQNYYLKDKEAREKIDTIVGQINTLEGVQGVMRYVGKVSTALYDGDVTPNISLAGKTDTYEAQHGDVVLNPDNSAEFVWLKTTPTSTTNDGHWELLGDESAYVKKGTYTVGTQDATVTVKATYQPAGDISKPTFTGETVTISSTASYRPAGVVSQPTFAGNTATIEVESTEQFIKDISGSITLPNGDVSKPTLTTSTATVTSTASYQPAGSVSLTGKSTVSVVKSIDTTIGYNTNSFINGASVDSEILSFSSGDAVTQVDPLQNYTTTVVLADITGATFAGTTATITSTGTYQVVTSVSKPTFSWLTTNSARTVSVVMSPTKDTVTSTTSYRPEGTISQPTFSGTTATITSTVSYQPKGEISKPDFTGTTATITSTGTYTKPTGSGSIVFE